MSNNNENNEPLNKSFREPKLRFPEFKDEWISGKLSDVANLIKRKSDGQNWPIMMISASKGFINQSEKYEKDNAGSSKNKYTLIKYGELAYNHGNSKVKKYGAVFALNEPGALIPFVYHSFSLSNSNNPFYFAKYLNLTKHDRYLVKVISSGARMDGLLNISAEDFFKLPINYPSVDEQNKINAFLDLVDKKIMLLNNEIETLKKYKEGYSKVVIKSCNNNSTILSTICDITTGKLDANAMSAKGNFKFFTCSREDYLIDTYAFDCEAILVSGNGDVGLTKYYKGKFNAYQRTYVLYNFKRDPLFIQLCIDSQIKSVIRKETNKGAMPYIKLSTFDKLIIPDLANDKEKIISTNIKLLKNKEMLLTLELEALSLIKKYLLNTLFI